MEKLLNVVNNTLFEVSRINSEQANPRDGLFDGRFITGPDRLGDVADKKPTHAIGLDVGNRALLFPTPSGHLAGRAIRDAVANQDVAPAENLIAHDAEAAPVFERHEVTALRTQTARVTVPHA